MKPIPCDCGGTLRPVHLRNYDLTVDLGIPAVARWLEGLRCSRCGWETIIGKTMKQVAHAVAGQLVDLPERLPATSLRFLRLYLDLTQKELAERMGIARKTVNEWECPQEARAACPTH